MPQAVACLEFHPPPAANIAGHCFQALHKRFRFVWEMGTTVYGNKDGRRASDLLAADRNSGTTPLAYGHS
jgi:hypothetical protein